MSLDFEQEALHSEKEAPVGTSRRASSIPSRREIARQSRASLRNPRTTDKSNLLASADRSRPHWIKVRSGLPFSTIYVESAVLLPLLTFFAVCTVPAGMNKTSPAFRATGVWPSS